MVDEQDGDFGLDRQARRSALITASMAVLSFSGTPCAETTGSMMRTSIFRARSVRFTLARLALLSVKPLRSAVATLSGCSIPLSKNRRPS